MARYNPSEIEPKWQSFWDSDQTFATDRLPKASKRYILDMFPYPSGDGLHVGHPEGYTATDIVSRFCRARGISVLHPMGFDAFGLPAEEHAIKTGEHPRIQTQRNIDNFTRQLKMLGFSYDWDRVLSTTDEDYFKWTQWIFLELFDTWFDEESNKGRPISELPIPDPIRQEGQASIEAYRDSKRLAYQDDALVNWCPALGTVLANEEVKDGLSDRGDHPVQRIPLRQWMLRITAYAERLLEGLDDLDWPVGIKKLQQDWIGRSTGAEVDFYIGGTDDSTWRSQRKSGGLPEVADDDSLRVYTTRPDTLFGATYMVVSPEHPLVDKLTVDAQRQAVSDYREKASFKSDRERTDGGKEKTGVFTGSHAINPVTGKPIPVWIADYVLAGYGTGAIMAVPAHDDRDFEFAKQFELPVIPVVDPPADLEDREAILAGEVCFVAEGQAINSGEFDGQTTEQVKAAVTASLANDGLGREAVNFKLRDWLFSRQRFWGEPFPILHEVDADNEPTGIKRAVPFDQLPVTLPDLEDFKPHGRPEPPLAKADDDWLYTTIDGKRYRRETNTMPQWAGSCWYFLRYIDPKNKTAMVDPELEKAWMPVDLYVGGAEHAVLHLLYSRFWHKVLYDRGHVSTPEPFGRLVNQGMILGAPQYHMSPTAYQESKSTLADIGLEGTTVGEGDKATVVLRHIDDHSDLRDDETEKKKGKTTISGTDIGVLAKADKMSKSRGNVVNPDDIVREYGADSLRLYEMFMGPLEATKPWSMDGVGGVRNFLDRVWRMIVDSRSDNDDLNSAINDESLNEDDNRVLHQTIKKVTEDTEAMSFNTAIARMMEFTNHFSKSDSRPRATMNTFLILLAPYAPHLAEELWSKLGGTGSIARQPWPTWDESAIASSTIEVPVQVNGKIKAKLQVAADIGKDDLAKVALADSAIKDLIEGKTIVKQIVVPGRLVNLVVK
ncbi:Leucine--tRNA ligase [Rubripirellula amarantea]|uniref:Leucine--tRNA ligase n=1 Tax=Rubripirellula amarantea TaxID=2527999 RepID=A0A5C5WDB3_9BACT|nr:leucine--tRNA ligase [Rubripirellula amarantea]TWT48071.1 Leucine--tRNA ligase [Rubripirellula amarantea]